MISRRKRTSAFQSLLLRDGRCHSLPSVDRIIVDVDKEWLSVTDICEYMDVSPFVVTSQLRSGNLAAVKFGREWRVARSDFEDWINAQRLESRGRRPDRDVTTG